jgi:choline dehydrogenase-like flavoprotein
MEPSDFESFNDYIAKQLGPLGFLDQVWSNYNSTINTDYNWPDVHVSAITTSYNTNPNHPYLEYGLTLNAWNKMYSPYVGRPAIVFRAGIARPRSRGWLRLATKDPYDHPLININYLSNIEDVIIAINGLRWHYRVAQSKTFRKARAEMFATLVTGCEHLFKVGKDKLFPHMLMPSDEYLECQARSMIVSGFHQCCTNKMGLHDKDRYAVVDPTLKVYGVSGLRVIDASIMPVIPISNTNAATMMIAEMGSQFIIDEYNLKGYGLRHNYY